MRQLRISVRTKRGALPLVVAATVVSGAACGGELGTVSSGGGSGGADASRSSTTGDASMATGAALDTGIDRGSTATGTTGTTGNTGTTGTTGIVITMPDASRDGTTGSPPVCLMHYTVPLPAEGVPAEPGQICSAQMMPVEASRAARVALVADPLDITKATGTVEIPSALLGSVVGTPVIEVIDANTTWLSSMRVSNLRPTATGFAFDATFANVSLSDMLTRMTVRVTLDVDCAGTSMSVHAASDVHLCVTDTGHQWASAGDDCATVCRIIAEMAPSPIVPDKHSDDLPLAQAMRLRIVELARVANTIVLLAENDGGTEAEYEWHASAGSIERLAPDVVAWTLAEGMAAPLIQAAVWNDQAAAVATFAFNEEAA